MSNLISNPNLSKHEVRSFSDFVLNFKFCSVFSRHYSICNFEIVDQQSHLLICDLHVANEFIHEDLNLNLGVSIKQLTTSAIDQ